MPHGGARSLITRRTSTIGVVLPDLFGEFFSEAIRGIDRAARAAGYHVLVSGSHGDGAEAKAALRAMRGRVDGLVVMSPNVDAPTLRANLPEGWPVMLLNCAVDGAAFDSLNVDNGGGAFAMVRHLAALGHRRIAFVTGPADNLDAQERLRGYRDAILEVGRRDVPRARGAGRLHGGIRVPAAARIALGMRPRPTAIFAANDSMAIGLLSAFQELGVRVPGDVAVGGLRRHPDRALHDAAPDLRRRLDRGPRRARDGAPPRGAPRTAAATCPATNAAGRLVPRRSSGRPMPKPGRHDSATPIEGGRIHEPPLDPSRALRRSLPPRLPARGRPDDDGPAPGGRTRLAGGPARRHGRRP